MHDPPLNIMEEATYYSPGLWWPYLVPFHRTALLQLLPYAERTRRVLTRNHHEMEHKSEGVKQHSVGLLFASVGSTAPALRAEMESETTCLLFGRSLKDQVALTSVLGEESVLCPCFWSYPVMKVLLSLLTQQQ